MNILHTSNDAKTGVLDAFDSGSELDCKHPRGQFEPVIDRNRCEGKESCVAACPYGVLVMGKITRNERSELGIVGWLKAVAHGGTQVRAVSVDRCQACGECVRVCPEHAITLRRVVSPSSLEI